MQPNTIQDLRVGGVREWRDGNAGSTTGLDRPGCDEQEVSEKRSTGTWHEPRLDEKYSHTMPNLFSTRYIAFDIETAKVLPEGASEKRCCRGSGRRWNSPFAKR